MLNALTCVASDVELIRLCRAHERQKIVICGDSAAQVPKLAQRRQAPWRGPLDLGHAGPLLSRLPSQTAAAIP